MWRRFKNRDRGYRLEYKKEHKNKCDSIPIDVSMIGV